MSTEKHDAETSRKWKQSQIDRLPEAFGWRLKPGLLSSSTVIQRSWDFMEERCGIVIGPLSCPTLAETITSGSSACKSLADHELLSALADIDPIDHFDKHNLADVDVHDGLDLEGFEKLLHKTSAKLSSNEEDFGRQPFHFSAGENDLPTKPSEPAHFSALFHWQELGFANPAGTETDHYALGQPTDWPLPDLLQAGFEEQRTASTVNTEIPQILLEDARTMPSSPTGETPISSSDNGSSEQLSSPSDSIASSCMSEGERSFVLNEGSTPLYSADEDDVHRSAEHVAFSLVDDFIATCRTLLRQSKDSAYLRAVTGYDAAPGSKPESLGSGSGTGCVGSGSSASGTDLSSWSTSSSSRIDGGKDQDEDGDGCQRRKRPRTETQDQSWLSRKLFACPYCKYDRKTYSERNGDNKAYRKCATSYLSSISRVKQHLYRVHKRPDQYCSCCYAEFQTSSDRESHERVRACSPVQCPFPEKMTHEKMQQVKRRVMNKDDVEAWFDIYRVLFPGSSIPTDPWPMTENVPGSLVDEFLDFFQAEAPARLSADLGPSLIGEAAMPELQAFMEATVGQALTRLIEGLRNDFTPYGGFNQI